MPVVVSPEALEDLASIRAYLAERNLVAALALTARLSDAMFSLEDMSSRGRPRLLAGLRELHVPPHVITYRVSSDRVQIVRVWHVAQARS